jgi:ribosomal protein L24
MNKILSINCVFNNARVREKILPAEKQSNAFQHFSQDTLEISMIHPEKTVPIEPSDKVEVFIHELESRLSRDPRTLLSGDYVAVVSGKEKSKEVCLMKIISVEDFANGKMVTYQGVTLKSNEKRVVDFLPLEPRLQVRFISKEDKVVPLMPDEFRNVYTPANVSSQKVPPMDGITEKIFVSFLKNDGKAIILGNVVL